MPTRGALVATTEALASQRSAFRPLLSHNVASKRVKHQACLSVLRVREQLRRWRQQLVTRSIAESDAAWGATGNRGRHRQEGGHWQFYIIKKGHPFEMSFSIKVAMTYSPTNICSTIGAVGLNFSVRDGKRWIPDAIDRLNKCKDRLTLYNVE